MGRTLALIAILLLTGCAGQGAIDSLKPVCDALIGPIKYSSSNKSSPRYAAPQLAPDLKRRNQVGVNLRCPPYQNPGR